MNADQIFSLVLMLVAAASCRDLYQQQTEKQQRLRIQSPTTPAPIIRISFNGLEETRKRSQGKTIIPITRFNQEIQEGVENHVNFAAANGIDLEEDTLIKKLGGQYAPSALIYAPGYGSDEPNSNSYNSNYGNYGNEEETIELIKKGHYYYISPEGEKIRVDWIADKDGFRPTGSHIPTTAAPKPAPFSFSQKYY